MKILSENKGIALVTSLMLTLISLTIVMALLYMITRGTQLSAQQKKYKSSLEATYGGTEILTKDVIPLVLRNYSSPTLNSDVTTAFSNVNMQVTATQSCLQSKLTKPTASWPSGCSGVAEPKKAPDMTFTLSATTGSPFIVYSKIIDTISGNTDLSGLQLEGAGVSESTSVLTPQHFPYVYRLEVQGERQSSATTQANIEVLYAY